MVKLNDTNKRKWDLVWSAISEAKDRLKQHLPGGREAALAITKIEESAFWAWESLEKSQEFINQGSDPGNGLGGKNE